MQRRYPHVILCIDVDVLFDHEIDDVLLGGLARNHQQGVAVGVSGMGQNVIRLQRGQKDLVRFGIARAVVGKQVKEQIGRLLGDFVVHLKVGQGTIATGTGTATAAARFERCLPPAVASIGGGGGGSRRRDDGLLLRLWFVVGFAATTAHCCEVKRVCVGFKGRGSSCAVWEGVKRERASWKMVNMDLICGVETPAGVKQLFLTRISSLFETSIFWRK